jgi:hypothetical protein
LIQARDNTFEAAWNGNGHFPGIFTADDVSPVWPELNDKALYGLSGEIVSTAAPHTEADTPALLVNILVGFGNAAGRNPHVKVGADHHRLNHFAVLVGATSKGRKGMSWGIPRNLCTP